MGKVATTSALSCGGGRAWLAALRTAARKLGRLCERQRRVPAQPCQRRRRDETADVQVIATAGDLRDTCVLQSFRRRCEQALTPGQRRVVVDLERVATANTKLIATLVVLRRWAEARGVLIDLTVTDHVSDWIALCQVEWMLHARVCGSALDRS